MLALPTQQKSANGSTQALPSKQEGILERVNTKLDDWNETLDKIENREKQKKKQKEAQQEKSEKREKGLIESLGGWAILIVVVIGIELFFGPVAQHNVRGSHLSAFSTEVTIGEAFSQFFGNPEWSYFLGENGMRVVEFRGEFMHNSFHSEAHIQFILSGVPFMGGAFEIHAVEFNGVPQNQLMQLSLLNSVFSE